MEKVVKDLLIELQYIEKHYNEAKTTGEDFNFYQTVKPYVQHIDDILNKLNQYQDNILLLPYMNEKKLKLLFNNIKELSVDCHFHRTSRKLFIEKFKAVNYDLNYLLEYTKE
ncbi:DUF1798 family protein [Staphylococcus sp. NRL 16/872]|uniref:DUF1798 family protein n=1 Tax=Staphylococcus sp. NRL 16/872 TaxID=2930131 RepID=UPI001FB2E47D|nr:MULTISPECIES: DUF1798 family protein [unclassified Staphylococcus]MCJ1656356.1 YppE family protein [Staphylococcus sp. NRL 21/187]MCJ1662116.1 YppE family protein [Staphylococcus sp. NRL 18/288]MCJ1668182.1 YppE family protein [Staphylococcus sp. NRL 19/737]WEN68382.1 DUF1798 family protein [Staphylococcus sp. NRL 16/872]